MISWSSGYYPGWQQGGHPPSTLPWTSITYLIQFSVATSTARDGSINVGAHQLTPAFMQAAVAEAHRQNRKILISVGGASDNNFDAACNATNRSKFINNLVSVMQTYGYDGIDLDIEQDFGFPAHTDFIACVAGFRAALDNISPRPTLTEAFDPDWQSYMASQVWRSLDQINLMSYYATAAAMPTKLIKYTNQGVPRAKIGIGLGLGSDGGIDTTPAACEAKAAFVAANGYGGVMEWQIQDRQTAIGGQTCLGAVASHLR